MLGFPADEETRRARSAAHSAFDPVWQSGALSRQDAYAWLGRRLRLPVDKVHLSQFDAATSWRVVNLMQRGWAEIVRLYDQRDLP